MANTKFNLQIASLLDRSEINNYVGEDGRLVNKIRFELDNSGLKDCWCTVEYQTLDIMAKVTVTDSLSSTSFTENKAAIADYLAYVQSNLLETLPA